MVATGVPLAVAAGVTGGTAAAAYVPDRNGGVGATATLVVLQPQAQQPSQQQYSMAAAPFVMVQQ